MIEGTYLAFEYMSTRSGGKGGTVVNVSSMGGKSLASSIIHTSTQYSNNIVCACTRYLESTS